MFYCKVIVARKNLLINRIFNVLTMRGGAIQSPDVDTSAGRLARKRPQRLFTESLILRQQKGGRWF